VTLTTSFRRRILDTIQVRLFPSPVRVRHAVYSMVYSEDDAVSGPSARLLEVAAKALMLARDIDLQDVCNRMRGRFPYPDSIVNLWPGEHYRLLAALVQLLRPRLVIEIGTAEGLSALALLKYLPAGGAGGHVRYRALARLPSQLPAGIGFFQWPIMSDHR
jgi:hypothetical protein